MFRERRKKAPRLKKRIHTIDLRGILPLFFRRYYFVIQIGRDTRDETQIIEAERRYKVKKINNFIFALFLLVPIFIVFLLLLYYLKSALGINIMDNLHLSDLLDRLYEWLDKRFNL